MSRRTQKLPSLDDVYKKLFKDIEMDDDTYNQVRLNYSALKPKDRKTLAKGIRKQRQKLTTQEVINGERNEAEQEEVADINLQTPIQTPKKQYLEKTTCECGAVITNKNLSQHLKSKRHQMAMKQVS